MWLTKHKILTAVMAVAVALVLSALIFVGAREARADFVAPAPAPLERSVARAIAQGQYHRRTINVFLPWNQDRYDPARYGLSWAASPARPKGTIALTEIFWAYTRPGKSYTYYRGLDPFITKYTWNPRSESSGSVRTDYTNPAFADFIARAAGARARQFGADGVFLDWWNDDHPNNIPEAVVQKARRRIIEAIRAVNGPGFLIVANTSWYWDKSTHSVLNGAYLEMYKGRSGPYTADELREIERLLIFHDKNLQEPKIVALEGQRITRKTSDSDRLTRENIGLAKLFAAMATVIPRNGYVLYGDNTRDSRSGDHYHVYYDFYDIDLGQPASGGTRIAEGLWYRAFTGGLVVFNRTDSAATVAFPKWGKLKLPPRSGLFCSASGSRLRCQ